MRVAPLIVAGLSVVLAAPTFDKAASPGLSLTTRSTNANVRYFTMYREPYFKGTWIDYTINYDTCLSLVDDQTTADTWFSSFQGLQDANPTPFTCWLSRNADCTGESITTDSNLIFFGILNNLVQSIKCSWSLQTTEKGVRDTKPIFPHEALSTINKRDDTKPFDWKLFLFYDSPGYTGTELDLVMLNNVCYDFNSLYTAQVPHIYSFRVPVDYTWMCSFYRGIHCANQFIQTSKGLVEFGPTPDDVPQSVRCYWYSQGPSDLTSQAATEMNVDVSSAEQDLTTRQENTKYFTFYPGTNYTDEGLELKLPNDQCKDISKWQTDDSLKFQSFSGFVTGRNWTCIVSRTTNCTGNDITTTTNIPDFGTFEKQIQSVRCTWSWTANHISTRNTKLTTRQGNAEFFSICPEANYQGVCKSWSVGKDCCNNFDASDSWSSFEGGQGDVYQCYLYTSFDCQGPNLMVVNDTPQIPAPFDNNVRSLKCTWASEVTLSSPNNVPTAVLNKRDTNAELLTVMLFPEINYNGNPVMFQFEPAGECITWFKGAWSSFGGSLASGGPFKCYLVAEDGCSKGAAGVIVTQNTPDLGDWKNKARAIICKWGSNLNDPPATDLIIRDSNTDIYDLVEKELTEKEFPSTPKNAALSAQNQNVDTLTATFYIDINYQGIAKGIEISSKNHCYTISANDFVIGSFKASMFGGQNLFKTDVPDLGKYKNDIKSLDCYWGSSSSDISAKEVISAPKDASLEAVNATQVINISVCSGINYTGVCNTFSITEDQCQYLGDNQVASFNANRPLGGRWSCFLEPKSKCQSSGGFGTTQNVPDLGRFGHFGNKTQNFTNQVHSVNCFFWDTADIAEKQINPVSTNTDLTSRDSSHDGQILTTWCSGESWAENCLDIWFDESTCYHFGSAAAYSSFKALVPYAGYMYTCTLKTGNNCDGDSITVQDDQVSFDSGRLDNKIHSASCTWAPIEKDVATMPAVDSSTGDIDNSIVAPITKDLVPLTDIASAEQMIAGISNTTDTNTDPTGFFIEFCPLINYGGDCYGFTIPADKSCHKTYLEGQSTHPWQSFRGYANQAWSCFVYNNVDCNANNAVILEGGAGLNGVRGDPDFGQWRGQIVAVTCWWAWREEEKYTKVYD